MRTRLAASALVAVGAAMSTTALPTMASASADGAVIVEIGQPPSNCPFGYTGVHGTVPVVGGYEVCTILPPPQ